MVFSAIALVINYDAKAQGDIVRKYAPPGILFMGIGIMIGVLDGTSMVMQMVDIMLSVMPASFARYTNVIRDIIAMPIGVTPSHPAHVDILSKIPADRMDYTPFIDSTVWPAFLEERADNVRSLIKD